MYYKYILDLVATILVLEADRSAGECNMRPSRQRAGSSGEQGAGTADCHLGASCSSGRGAAELCSGDDPVVTDVQQRNRGRNLRAGSQVGGRLDFVVYVPASHRDSL